MAYRDTCIRVAFLSGLHACQLHYRASSLAGQPALSVHAAHPLLQVLRHCLTILARTSLRNEYPEQEKIFLNENLIFLL